MNDKDFKRNRKKLEQELNTLIKKNKDNIFYVELAKDYLLKLENISTLDDLNTLRQKFVKDLNNLEYRMNFFKLKKSFKETLSNEIYNNPNDLEIQKLVEEYEGKLFDANTLEKLSSLITKFKNSLNILKNLKHQEMLDSRKGIFLNNLISVENSYSDQETIELLDFCRSKITEIKTFNDLNELEKLFREKFQKIRNYEKSALKFKDELKKQFLRYLEGIYKEEYQELVEDYLNMLKERENFKELRELEESFQAEVVLLNKEIEKQEEKCKNLKEMNKKACIFRFYQLSENSSHDKIMQAKEVLVKLLEILDASTIRDIDVVTIFLSELDFSNLNETVEKIKFFEFSKSDKVKIINQEYFQKLLTLKNPLEEEIEFLDNDTLNIKNKIRKSVLLKFHYYAIKSDIKSILTTIDDLTKVFNVINEMSEDELKEKYQVFTNIDFKDMNKTNNLLSSLKDSSNIYIDYKKGKLYTVKIEKEEAFIISVDSIDENIYVISKEELNKNYISVREFFQQATFVDGRDVNERIDNFNTYEPLFIFGQEYLYCYKNLMLVYYGNGFGKESNSLKFITTDKGYAWNLTGGCSNNDIIRRFSDRDLCEETLIEQVETTINSYRELNKYKRNPVSSYISPSIDDDYSSKKI